MIEEVLSMFKAYSKRYISRILAQAGVQLDGSAPCDVRVLDERFYSRLFFSPTLGAGESYVSGWWECDRVDELFYKIARHYQHQNVYPTFNLVASTLSNWLFNLQNQQRSHQVAEKHYNLGNDLYIRMLGPSMAYTCAYWKDAQTLDEAQAAKFDLVCRKIGLKAGDRILDLGCGWGSFARFAAENYGCSVVAVNISEEQIDYCREKHRNLPIRFFLNDYREDSQYNPDKLPFDHVISIGLCEHVGHKNYRHLMQIARNNLKEEGLFLLHTIGKNDSSSHVDPWIDKYIFPNGMLPSISLLGAAAENLFVVEDLHNFGADYDKTLMAWHRNFVENWPQLQGDFGADFFRMWSYYLLSCAGAFRARSMQLWQWVLSPNGVLGGYQPTYRESDSFAMQAKRIF